MSQAQYEIYRTKVMALARSLVIKCGPAADAMNAQLEMLGHNVNLADPASWKYYLNLNGDYHPSDQMMTVTSLDTLQTIEFRKETLAIHRTTAREYAFGSRYYNALVEQYPDQEMLIQGIMNPVDPARAIAAADGSVLYYDPDLVEENETNLIPQLESWMQKWWARWYVPAYAFPDDLYTAAIFGKMVMIIPTVIMNLRLRNCNTLFAHSFHIRQHLASHGRLDVYVDYLTKKQMLWLYRNVIYLHRHAGKRETFNELLEHILTQRALPLGEWRMRHNTQEQAEAIYPAVEFNRQALNLDASAAGSDTRNIPQMLDAEQRSARNNLTVQPVAELQIKEQMENASKNILETKILESSILDLSESTTHTLTDSLINHWLQWAAEGQYTSVITVDNPKTGGTLTIDVREAFIIFLYTYNASMGITLPNIPPLQAQMVRRDPAPNRQTLYDMVDQRYVDHRVVDQIADQWSPVGSYISVPAFHDAVILIHQQKLRQREIYSNVEHYLGRAQAEAVMQHMYHDVPVDIDAGQSYLNWFNDRGLDIASYSELEAGLIANQIFASCTGVGLQASQSLRDIQGAMLRLMAHMSSYSIQFLQSINSSPIKVIDWPALRPGEEERYLRHEDLVYTIDVGLQEIEEFRRHELDLDLSDVGVNPERHAYWRAAGWVDTDLHVTQDSRVRRHQSIGQGAPQIISVQAYIPELGTDTPIVDTDNYLPVGKISLSRAFTQTYSDHYRLTEDERQQIQARWAVYNDQPFEAPLVDLFPITRLSSLWPYLQSPMENTIQALFPSHTLASLVPFIYAPSSILPPQQGD